MTKYDARLSVLELRRSSLPIAGLLFMGCATDDRTDMGSDTSGEAPESDDSMSTETEGTDDTGGDEGRICDGSSGIRFVARQTGGDSPTFVEFGPGGFRHLYIRGDCRYWVKTRIPPDNGWFVPERTGVLSEQQESELIAAAIYEQWTDLEGLYDAQGLLDSGWQYSNGRESIVCPYNCEADTSAPIELQKAAADIREQIQVLYAVGEPVDPTSPLRVDVPQNAVNSQCPSWPFPVSEDSLSYEGDLPQEQVVSDPIVTRAMRDIVAEYRAGKSDECNTGVDLPQLIFQHSTMPAVLLFAMRDSLPFEDEDGTYGIPDPVRFWPLP